MQVAHHAAVLAGKVKNEDWPEWYAECLGEAFVSWALAAYNPCQPHPCDPEAEVPHDQETVWKPIEIPEDAPGYD